MMYRKFLRRREKRSVVAERGVKTPTEPIVFLKPSTSYITQGQEIKIPQGFEVHHEIELGAVIGKVCKNVEPNKVKEYIGGYCLALDLTAVNVLKEARESGHPWTLGKSFDTACPVSRILTADQLLQPHDIRLWCAVNGIVKQDSSTSGMIFPTDALISYISKYMTLEPYDLILTGSPSGTGVIKSGDILTAGLGNALNIEFKVA
ncbi:oxaloacetate tautomerase FAHD1, mitochondrial isoform X2 [Rhodnius prolixus]|uniref:oxaloacetate tautomerase FAHD1, mitochondrial isoform X2 n=1 Tax=Rhodnius prolixus TaxID=13249 RepID=UPI003D18AE92